MAISRRTGAVRRRHLTSAFIAATAVLLAVSLIARALPVSGILHLVMAVGAPYIAVASLLGLTAALWHRRTLAVLAAVLLAVAAVGLQVSWYYLGRTSGVIEPMEIRVLSVNLNRGRADPAAFVAAAENDADIITVAELTPEAVRRFLDAGINRNFPHSHLLPESDAKGIGIWSRYPLAPIWGREGADFVLAAHVRVSGVRIAPVIASMHIISPVADDSKTVDNWKSDIASARVRLDGLAGAAGRGSVIIGGDFNSTSDLRQFRDLLTNGYRDAVDQSGAGFAPTYPTDTWYPPVITIDHVLLNRAAAASVRTVAIPGSDHRGVLAMVQVPKEPAVQ